MATTYGEGKYAIGEEVTVGTYTENEHYLFRHWTRDGEVISEDQEFTFTIDGQDVKLTAVYEENPDNPIPHGESYGFELLVNDEEGGRVEGPESPVESGTIVSITAYPNEGYEFVKWCDANGELFSNESSVSFEMPAEDVTLIAYFKQQDSPDEPFDPENPLEPYAHFGLSTTCSPEGVATTYGDGTYPKGEKVIVGTYPNDDHYVFVNWTCDGKVISRNSEFTYTMKNVPAVLVAVYAENPDNPLPPENHFMLQVQSSDDEGGWVEGPELPVEVGKTVEITAHANEGYTFVAWCYDNGELLSGEATISFAMPSEDIMLTAYFEQLFNPDNPEEPYSDQEDVDNDFDVNQDGDTDVADVMANMLYLLDTPSDLFREDKADVNTDGIITVADGTKLVEYLVGSSDFANTTMLSVKSPVALSIQPETTGYSMPLPNSKAYTAFQMDITLGDRAQLQSIGLDGAYNPRHQVLFRQVSSATWRVVVFSLSNQRLVPGTLLRIVTDSGDLTASHIHFATQNGIDHAFDDLSTTTGIGTLAITGESTPLYDLQGRRVSHPKPGIYIQNGRKVIIP